MPQVVQAAILDTFSKRYNALWAHEGAGMHQGALLLAVPPAGQPGGESALTYSQNEVTLQWIGGRSWG